MRYKTTNKVSGEIVLGGLNLILKKNSTFDIDKGSSSHHELLWAIHNGYVEAVDVAAKEMASSKKKIYTNNSKKTITSSFLKSPLIPGQYIILAEGDPACDAMDKLVEMKLIDCRFDSDAPQENAKSDSISSSKSESKGSSAKPESRKSFNRNASKGKSENKTENKKSLSTKEDKSLNNSKINSESKPIVVSSSEKIIFVGENNEELDI